VSETVALIDYGSGNLRSAAKALERAARETGLNRTILVTDDPEAVDRAQRVVLPGVGAFADCKTGLERVPGLEAAVIRAVEDRAVPFLGICVGYQLMAQRGLEFGATAGFGWLKGDIAKMAPPDPALKIPQMGWNDLVIKQAHPLLDGLKTGDHAYFVHSFALVGGAADECLAEVDYGGPVVAIAGRNNMAGTQFHPEKSQATGLRLLANFLSWTP